MKRGDTPRSGPIREQSLFIGPPNESYGLRHEEDRNHPQARVHLRNWTTEFIPV